MGIHTIADHQRLLDRQSQLYLALAHLTAAVRETGARPNRAIYKPILAEAMARAEAALDKED